ncbi:hypothetical protein KLEP7_gp123 [Pseudaeromonas phage vB_PpeM_ KLEP7]|nr:hypothetical protein KLEP7_gp123 [Pseudaeromonas phage vB_PpeM_ KLEP7]
MNKLNCPTVWKVIKDFFTYFTARPHYTGLDALLIVFAMMSDSGWLDGAVIFWFMVITPIFFTSKYSVEKKTQENNDEHSQL